MEIPKNVIKMKKEYQAPQIALLECWGEPLMEGSGVESPDKGIGYGGVDDNGECDPESRQSWDIWDDADDTEW